MYYISQLWYNAHCLTFFKLKNNNSEIAWIFININVDVPQGPALALHLPSPLYGGGG